MVRHNNNSYNSCFLKGIILPYPSIFYIIIYLLLIRYIVLLRRFEKTHTLKKLTVICYNCNARPHNTLSYTPLLPYEALKRLAQFVAHPAGIGVGSEPSAGSKNSFHSRHSPKRRTPPLVTSSRAEDVSYRKSKLMIIINKREKYLVIHQDMRNYTPPNR